MSTDTPIVVVTCRDCGEWQGEDPVSICLSCLSHRLRRDSMFQWTPWAVTGARMKGFQVALQPLMVNVPPRGGDVMVKCRSIGGEGTRWFKLSGLTAEAEPA